MAVHGVATSPSLHAMTLLAAWTAAAFGLAVTMLVQGPCAVSGRIQKARNDGGLDGAGLSPSSALKPVGPEFVEYLRLFIWRIGLQAPYSKRKQLLN